MNISKFGSKIKSFSKVLNISLVGLDKLLPEPTIAQFTYTYMHHQYIYGHLGPFSVSCSE